VPFASEAIPSNEDHSCDELQKNLDLWITKLKKVVEGNEVLEEVVKEQSEACKVNVQFASQGNTFDLRQRLLDHHPS